MNIHTYTPGPKTLKSWTINANSTTEKLIHWVQQRNLRILLLRVTALLKLESPAAGLPLQQPALATYVFVPASAHTISFSLEWHTHTPLAWLHFDVGNMAKRHRGGDLRCPYLDIQNIQTTNVITANIPMLSSNCLIPSTTKCLCSLQSDIHTTRSSYLPIDMAMEERVLSCKSRPSPSQPLAEAPEFGTLVYCSGA